MKKDLLDYNAKEYVPLWKRIVNLFAINPYPKEEPVQPLITPVTAPVVEAPPERIKLLIEYSSFNWNAVQLIECSEACYRQPFTIFKVSEIKMGAKYDTTKKEYHSAQQEGRFNRAVDCGFVHSRLLTATEEESLFNLNYDSDEELFNLLNDMYWKIGTSYKINMDYSGTIMFQPSSLLFE